MKLWHRPCGCRQLAVAAVCCCRCRGVWLRGLMPPDRTCPQIERVVVGAYGFAGSCPQIERGEPGGGPLQACRRRRKQTLAWAGPLMRG